MKEDEFLWNLDMLIYAFNQFDKFILAHWIFVDSGLARNNAMGFRRAMFERPGCLCRSMLFDKKQNADKNWKTSGRAHVTIYFSLSGQ